MANRLDEPWDPFDDPIHDKRKEQPAEADESLAPDSYRIQPVDESEENADAGDPPEVAVKEPELLPALPRKKKRRRKRKKPELPASADSPPAPWQQAQQDALPEWVADTGWRERPVVSALWFPLTGKGWQIVPLYAGLLWISPEIPFFGLFICAMVMCYVAVLMLETANFTLEGIPGGPQWPDWLEWRTIVAGFMGLTSFLISGIPMFAGLLVMYKLGIQNAVLTLLLLSFSLFYVPMAFLALADCESDTALNPLLVFRGIGRMAKPYSIACGIAAASFLLPALGLLLLPIPDFVQLCVGNLLFLYSAVALMRAVSLLARKKLPLFEHDDDETDAV